MPKIYKYKIELNEYSQGQLVNASPIDGLFTTTQAFEYLNKMDLKLPKRLHVFRNNLHQFFTTAQEMNFEEIEVKMNFIPKDFTDKRNYTGFALALADNE